MPFGVIYFGSFRPIWLFHLGFHLGFALFRRKGSFVLVKVVEGRTGAGASQAGREGLCTKGEWGVAGDPAIAGGAAIGGIAAARPLGPDVKADAASRTAVLVCQGRAAADGTPGISAAGRFSDPTAAALLRDDERVPVEAVREGVPPQPPGERVRFEMVRACAEVMVPRTVAIDDAVRAQPCSQLVILGAGLDGRAWRMPELADVDVFEVDHPASQRDKRDRVGGLPPTSRSVHFVPVDFARDRIEVALAAAGHRSSASTIWIWEGVVPYLTRAQVEATTAAVSTCSAPGSRLVVNYHSPALFAAIGRLAATAVTALARQPNPLAGEPWRSTWRAPAMSALLARHGFAVTDDDSLLTLAAGLGLSARMRGSLRLGRIAVADLRAPAAAPAATADRT